MTPPPGRFEALLADGTFVVTAEIDPPDSADPSEVLRRAALFDGAVDAINATDGSGAHCHLSSLSVCVILLRAGYTPILQMSCRDRNRIAFQGDLLGAAALGIRNVLCLTGDGVQVGDHPSAKPVFDLDSIALLDLARTLRDERRFLSGRPITVPPALFLGGAENPFAPPIAMRAARVGKKAAAGARFIQLQYCFDLPVLRRFLAGVADQGLLDGPDRVHVLAGVGPLASARTARWIRSNVPGVQIPDALIDRLERAADPKAEGRALCTELVAAMRELPELSGVHLMAHRQNAAVADIVRASGVLGGRQPLTRQRSAAPTDTFSHPPEAEQPA